MDVFVTHSIFSENKSKLFYCDVPVSLFALKELTSTLEENSSSMEYIV